MANWIAKAIKRPGAFTAKAKKAGMSVVAYAKKVLKPGSKADARTKRQAALANTLRSFHKGGSSSAHRSESAHSAWSKAYKK